MAIRSDFLVCLVTENPKHNTLLEGCHQKLDAVTFPISEIEKAKTEPPQDTRARMRGDFIKLARQNNIQYDLDWSNIRLGNLLNVRVICNNPFETDTEKVTELVRTIQKTNLRRTSLSKLVIQS